MFGYVLINKEELKFKEYDVYKSYYCGLCQTLNNRSGRFAQLTLNYDMTFLQLLLTGLYEPETKIESTANALPSANASSLSIAIISSYIFVSRTVGTNPAPIP